MVSWFPDTRLKCTVICMITIKDTVLISHRYSETAERKETPRLDPVMKLFELVLAPDFAVTHASNTCINDVTKFTVIGKVKYDLGSEKPLKLSVRAIQSTPNDVYPTSYVRMPL